MRVFSGIKPTGDATFGNYSGGFRQYAATQEQGDAFFCIVDLHAITVDYDPVDLRNAQLRPVLVAHLDRARPRPLDDLRPEPRHRPCRGGLAARRRDELRAARPDDAVQGEERREGFISAALFNYPILMAGDILLYRADTVPIGDDQRQHLELARDVAERFNTRFGETFVVPDGVYPTIGARIMDLQDPLGKMGKTGSSEQGTIRMLDGPDVIRRKLKTAVTDSGSEVRRGDDKPGITNLIDIFSVATGETPEQVESRYDGAGYGQFKEDVGEAVIALLAPIQERFRELRADEGELRRLLAHGAEKARAASAPLLEQMYERMGFIRL